MRNPGIKVFVAESGKAEFFIKGQRVGLCAEPDHIAPPVCPHMRNHRPHDLCARARPACRFDDADTLDLCIAVIEIIQPRRANRAAVVARQKMHALVIESVAFLDFGDILLADKHLGTQAQAFGHVLRIADHPDIHIPPFSAIIAGEARNRLGHTPLERERKDGSRWINARRDCGVFRQCTHRGVKVCRCGLYGVIGDVRRRRSLGGGFRQSAPFALWHEVWGFVVAILLFSIGAGVSLVHGYEKIIHPHPIEKPWVNFVVIGLALIFEGYALSVAVKAVNEARGTDSFMAYVKRSKDAPLVVVLLEDTGALLGLAIAGIALAGAIIFDMPVLDGVASVLIGILLASIAIILAIETKGLLIGEAADPHIQAGIDEIIRSDEGIRAVNEILTMHMGPEDIFCALSVDFRDDETSRDVEEAISELETKIKARFPQVKRVFIEAQSVFGHMRALKASAIAGGTT